MSMTTGVDVEKIYNGFTKIDLENFRHFCKAVIRLVEELEERSVLCSLAIDKYFGANDSFIEYVLSRILY